MLMGFYSRRVRVSVLFFLFVCLFFFLNKSFFVEGTCYDMSSFPFFFLGGAVA